MYSTSVLYDLLKAVRGDYYLHACKVCLKQWIRSVEKRTDLISDVSLEIGSHFLHPKKVAPLYDVLLSKDQLSAIKLSSKFYIKKVFPSIIATSSLTNVIF